MGRGSSAMERAERQKERLRRKLEDRREKEQEKRRRWQEKDEEYRQRWVAVRSKFVGGTWAEIQEKLWPVFTRLQSRPVRLRWQQRITVPMQREDPGWKDVAKALTKGIIKNVIFVDTEFGRPEGACQHSYVSGGGAPPCYEEEDCDIQAFRQMTDERRVFDWEHVENIRMCSKLTNSRKCPALARCITIATSDGRGALIDLLHLGGCPPPIFHLLTDSAVHKIAFNLAADLPVLQVSIAGFPLVPTSYFDATFQWVLKPLGHLSARSGASWAHVGSAPTVPVVFHDVICGVEEPQRDYEPAPIGSLGALCEAFTDVQLPKHRDLTGRALDWFFRRPPNLSAADNRNVRRYYEYALLDAIALPIVYIGSLLVRPEWRSCSAVSPLVADWVNNLGIRLPMWQSPAPPPYPPCDIPRSPSPLPLGVDFSSVLSKEEYALVRAQFVQYRRSFRLELRRFRTNPKNFGQTNKLHHLIDAWRDHMRMVSGELPMSARGKQVFLAFIDTMAQPQHHIADKYGANEGMKDYEIQRKQVQNMKKGRPVQPRWGTILKTTQGPMRVAAFSKQHHRSAPY